MDLSLLRAEDGTGQGDVGKLFKKLENSGRRLFERENGRVLFVDCPQRQITQAQTAGLMNPPTDRTSSVLKPLGENTLRPFGGRNE